MTLMMMRRLKSRQNLSLSLLPRKKNLQMMMTATVMRRKKRNQNLLQSPLPRKKNPPMMMTVTTTVMMMRKRRNLPPHPLNLLPRLTRAVTTAMTATTRRRKKLLPLKNLSQSRSRR